MEKINLEKVEKYKNPKENDLILKTKKELDQTVTEMHKTIGQILDRGEKIDNLIEKSSNLNYQSKLFYKKIKKIKRLLLTYLTKKTLKPFLYQIYYQVHNYSYLSINS